MRSQITNNAAALKNLDLKLSLYLEKLTKGAESRPNSSSPTSIQADEVPVARASYSSTAEAAVGAATFVSPSSTTPQDSHRALLASNDESSQFVFSDVLFTRQANDSSDGDPTLSNVNVEATTRSEVPPETDSESEYEFSASFDAPSESPKVHLN